MRRRSRHALLGGIATLGIGLAVLAPPPLQASDATWTDAEHASAPLRAATLTSPSITSVVCARDGTGSSQRLSVRWAWPTSAVVASASWTLNGTTISPTTTANGPNDFTTVITNGLTPGLFGQTHTVELRAASGNWRASDRRQITFVAYSVLNPSCSVTG